MDQNHLNHALEVATDAAIQAGEYLIQEENIEIISEKSIRDNVLKADIESERMIIEILEKNFPTYGILAEESGSTRKDSSEQWIVDPLDGSFNFEHGDVTYGVMIGLLVDKDPILSAVYLPNTKELITAVKGEGTKKNGNLVSVSSIAKLSNARVHLGDFSKESLGLGNKERLEDMSKLAGKVGRIRMVGSAAVDFASVATGIADVLVVRRSDPWDFPIGKLLIEEAGGQVTEYNFPNGNLYIASNGRLHKEIEQLLINNR